MKDGVGDVNAGKQSHFLDRTEANQNQKQLSGFNMGGPP